MGFVVFLFFSVPSTEIHKPTVPPWMSALDPSMCGVCTSRNYLGSQTWGRCTRDSAWLVHRMEAYTWHWASRGVVLAPYFTLEPTIRSATTSHRAYAHSPTAGRSHEQGCLLLTGLHVDFLPGMFRWACMKRCFSFGSKCTRPSAASPLRYSPALTLQFLHSIVDVSLWKFCVFATLTFLQL